MDKIKEIKEQLEKDKLTIKDEVSLIEFKNK